MADYTHPEVLVSIDWLKQNLKTPNVRIVEVDVDPKLYAAGHIPGATSIPWATAVTNENTFKTADELRAIYLDQKRLDPKKATIAYCRIGERSSHTWFVLKYLLGFKDVKNYDGSWTEYGNLIGVPIAKGD